MGPWAGTHTDLIKVLKGASQQFLQESHDSDTLITESVFFWTLVFQLFIADHISQK